MLGNEQEFLYKFVVVCVVYSEEREKKKTDLAGNHVLRPVSILVSVNDNRSKIVFE